jgi:putative selenate reductase
MPEPGRMQPLPFDRLVAWISEEYEARQSIFGIPDTLFYQPQRGDPYAAEVYGQRLGTPIGPAAGPHTQLAENIASAWLCGGRYIELKTVQVLDQLEIPRPCRVSTSACRSGRCSTPAWDTTCRASRAQE